MDITAVRVIRPKDRTSPVLCFADISIDTGLQLRDMRLLRNREEGGPPLLRMPTQRTRAGERRDVFNPISTEVRTQMTAAVVQALKDAEEAGVNERTTEFSVEPHFPQFTNAHVRRFPQNRQLKAFASCIVDDAVALNRMAILLDEDTKMFRVSMPKRESGRASGTVSYYRMQLEEYQSLYGVLMDEYTAAGAEPAEA